MFSLNQKYWGFLLPILLLTHAPELRAQAGMFVDWSRMPFWFSVGYGYGSTRQSAHFGGSFFLEPWTFGFRAAMTGLWHKRSFVELGLLAGHRLWQRGTFTATLGLGVGAVHGSQRKLSRDARDSLGTKVSAMLEVQLFWRIRKHFGLGVYGYGNVNGLQSFFGANVSLMLGRFSSGH